MSQSHDRLAVDEVDEDAIQFVDDERFAPENGCLVTGAASGIGRATALATAAIGPTAVAAVVDADGLAETAGKVDDLDVDGGVTLTYE